MNKSVDCPAKNECKAECDPLQNPCWHHQKMIDENDKLRKALEIALYDLNVCNNLLATDLPDLVNLDLIVQVRTGKSLTMKDITWIIDNSDSIKAVEKALNGDEQ